MSNDLFLLIQQDRESLANLTRGFTQADPDNRARRANEVTSQSAMMVHGENVVIYPPLQESSAEGAAMVQGSLKRLHSIVDDFDRLERMTFSDFSYPSFFDQTLIASSSIGALRTPLAALHAAKPSATGTTTGQQQQDTAGSGRTQ
ncbi:hypothetical protein BGX29_001594 [Mortierella sp. GBA35]|nr:hypothetical protein BGX29_001594 [Mortierella sp. GBA35]